MNSPRALIITAHADDHITCAGTIFKLRDRGYEVFEVLLTDSREGNDRRDGKELDTTDQVVSLREEEFGDAAKFLGVKERFMFKREDLDLNFDKEIMLGVMKIIRYVKPDVIFTMNEVDYHKDHIASAVITREASFWAATGIRPELGDPHRTDLVLYGEGMLPIEADVLVDITGYEEKKFELFRIYESQANSKSLEFEKSLGQVRGYHLRQSKQIEYAEAFTLNTKFPSILFNDDKTDSTKKRSA